MTAGGRHSPRAGIRSARRRRRRAGVPVRSSAGCRHGVRLAISPRSTPLTKAGDSSVESSATRRNRLGDRDRIGQVEVVDLEHRDPERVAVDPRHPRPGSSRGPAPPEIRSSISAACATTPSTRSRGVVAHRRVGVGRPLGQGRERVGAAQLGLEQDVQGPLAGLAPGRRRRSVEHARVSRPGRGSRPFGCRP